VKVSRFVLALLVLTGLTSPADAVDLTTIPRKVAKEPAYRAKSPYYCLLVFGPEAKTRVWLVLDGDRLYVDRNGNGDLTEKGERVALPPLKERKEGFVEGEREVKAGTITAGPVRCELRLAQLRLRKGHKPATPEEAESLRLMQGLPDQTFTAVMVIDSVEKGKLDDLAVPKFQVASVDSEGVLRFAARPQDAPIIHVHGPLKMGLHPMQKLVRGQVTELRASVGTPGLGKGTFVMMGYQGRIPGGVHPVAEVEFPPAAPGKAPVKTKVTLSQRC
jgi:hypothetical protein